MTDTPKHTVDELRRKANSMCDYDGETASMLRAGADAMHALAKAEARVKVLEDFIRAHLPDKVDDLFDKARAALEKKPTTPQNEGE